MEERQIEGLRGSVQQGQIMEDFYRHPGMSILKRELENKISDAKHQWLNAKSALEAEEIRIKTKPYQEVYDLISHKILQGRAAQESLRKIEENEE